MMHLDDLGLTADVFEDLVEPVTVMHQTDGTLVVNLDGTVEKAVPHAFDVFAITAIPVASLESFDRLDRFEAGDSRF